ncbi:MAG: helix-turn-helix domain-containing protein [Sphingomicrobium sp.]
MAPTPDQRPFGRHFREIRVAGFDCTLSRATVPKEDLPEHIHPNGQVILAIDRGYLSRAFDADERGRGLDLVYNPPGTVHRDCFVDPGGRFLSISAPARLAPRLADPLRLESHCARSMAARVAGICAQGVDGDRLELELEQLILNLLARAEAKQDVAQRPRWLARAHELIAAQSLDQHASIGAIATALELHPVYFARAFTTCVGHSPAKAMRVRRLSAATALLSRDVSLAEIASSCGFADQSHFCRSVRKVFGISPGVLRTTFQ